ncbi:hypothetical protein VCHA37P199_30282 [Vibrio chagasii]|nr:hypothetical protein VCHA37P199_30282 [Vibrio chagasii]
MFAEFDLNIRSKRQMKGIAAAKVTGKYKDRKPVSLAIREKIIPRYEHHYPITSIDR